MRNRGPMSLHVELKDMLIGFNRLSINNINNGSQPFLQMWEIYLSIYGEIINFKDLIKFKKQKLNLILKMKLKQY